MQRAHLRGCLWLALGSSACISGEVGAESVDATDGLGDHADATDGGIPAPTPGAPARRPTPTPTPTDADDEPSWTLNCCTAHPEPGCFEADVATCVCQTDAVCCTFAWDSNCVSLALHACDAECTEAPVEAGGCESSVLIELTPQDDAELSGSWTLVMSQAGEGMIASAGQTPQGSVVYRPQIPCEDEYFVWVRAFDRDHEDSYFVRVDEWPATRAVFEADCTAEGSGWGWVPLNRHDPQIDGLCEYQENPWTQDFAAGPHELEFTFRESPALGRVLVTNDPDFVPS